LGEPIEKYPYTDGQGNILLYSCRFKPKAFRQCTPDGLTWKVQGIRQVPYHLERLLSSTGLVLIVEGEKDVHAAEAMGYTATTNAGGAGNWTDEHSQYLAGRDAVIISDDDDAGYARNEKVAASLARVGGGAK
jgi:putative DNA primase/helicase